MPKYFVEKDEYCEIWRNEKGQIHREDGPAIIYFGGFKEWWVNGKRHREDGPAVIYPNGTQYWYINGQLHREDGPAITNSSGGQYWYINGKELTEQEFNDRNKSLDGKEITIDGITYTLKRK